MDPYTSFNTRVTPQSEPIPGQVQVRNSAGGFVYTLDDFAALERFLMLGSEGGTYYVSEHTLTLDNALRGRRAIQTDGPRAVQLIVAVSEGGRAPKNDPAIFALALAAADPNPATRAMALAQLPRVCRVPTHLFHFCTYVQNLRGWGRGLKRPVAAWYQNKDVNQLAYQVTKYQSRDGWSNADVLRLTHPDPDDPQRNGLYKWIVDGWAGLSEEQKANIPPIIEGFEEAKRVTDLATLVGLIKEYNLSREMLPTEALTHAEVWEALLDQMLPEAMMRNLATMTRVGLLKPLSTASKTIVERLTNQALLQKARLHPIQLLMAYKTYSSGMGRRGSNTWTPVPAVVDTLNDAFYLAFKYLPPTGKRFLFGVDVSGSMASDCGDTGLSCAEGAAAMALACAHAEREYYIHGFTAGTGRRPGYWGEQDPLGGFVDLGITPKMSLNECLKRTRDMNFGATDAALPFLWALKNKVEADVIVVITDNETWAGKIHPSQALKMYRDEVNPEAKLLAVGMTATDFTIAPTDDPGCLNVAGFDASVPQVLQHFAQ